MDADDVRALLSRLEDFAAAVGDDWLAATAREFAADIRERLGVPA